MSEVHQLKVRSFYPRGSELDHEILPRNYVYNLYVKNLRRPWINQIFLDLCKNVYDIDMLSRIIQSGQLDGSGCLTIEGMKQMRFCQPDYGLEILN